VIYPTPATSQTFFTMVFNNEVCDNARGTLSTYTLNQWFKFVAIGDEATMRATYGSSPVHVICIFSNLSAFCAMFLYLSLEQLTAVAFAHHIPLVLNKPALLHAIIRHICSRHCENQRLVFTRLLRPRSGPFFAHASFDSSEADL
jgi:hypothetical protein